MAAVVLTVLIPCSDEAAGTEGYALLCGTGSYRALGGESTRRGPGSPTTHTRREAACSSGRRALNIRS